MCACNSIKIKNSSVCTGDLRFRIKIQERSKAASSDITSMNYVEEFKDLFTYYAAVETNRGRESFSQVGTNSQGADSAYTHKFYIRFSNQCVPTSENWIEYDCDKYKILSVENLGERNKFLALRCVKKGTKSKDANLA